MFDSSVIYSPNLVYNVFYLLHAFCAFVAFQALTTTATPNDNYICAIPLTAPPRTDSHSSWGSNKVRLHEH